MSADAKFVASDFPDMGARVDENAPSDPRADAAAANLHGDDDSDTDDEGGQEGDD